MHVLLINIPVITQNFDKLIAENFYNLPFNQFNYGATTAACPPSHESRSQFSYCQRQKPRLEIEFSGRSQVIHWPVPHPGFHNDDYDNDGHFSQRKFRNCLGFCFSFTWYSYIHLYARLPPRGRIGLLLLSHPDQVGQSCKQNPRI